MKSCGKKLWTAGALAACVLGTAVSAHGQVKISEIWGSGGNTASGPNADYVELFNAGSSAQSLSGWSLQVAAGSSGTWTSFALPAVSLPAKTYFLVRINTPSATGTPLPTPDVAGTASGALLTTGSGKVALRSSTTLLTGNPSCPFAGDIVDFVGYGSASQREPCGGAVTNNSPSNQISPSIFSTQRLSFGCFDSNLNVADFAQAEPTPQNTSDTASSLDEISATITPTTVIGGNEESVSVQAWVRACAAPILGATVTADLSQFSLPTLTLLDNGIDDDGVAGNGRYGRSFTVPQPTNEGEVSFNVSFVNGPSNGSTSVTLTIRPFAPENDNCEDATDLTNSLPYFATISNETASPDLDVGTCNTDGSVTRFGFWYRYDAAASGILRFTETGTQDIVYGVFGVFNPSDPCNSLDVPVCIATDTASVPVTAGQTYYVLVGNQTATEATAGPTVPIQMSIEFIPPPANNDCANAIPIFFQFNEFIDASSATGDIDVSCNAGGAFDTVAGVWYSFTTGSEAGVIVITETGTTDIVTALFTGGCDFPFEVTCQQGETSVHPVDANTEYRLLVGAQGTAQPTVAYAFSIDFFTAPANDLCPNAITIDLNSEFSDTVGAISAGPDIDVACNSGAAFETQAGVWYKFTTGAEGGRLRINETSTADTVKALFEGTDCSLFEVACADAEDNTFNLEAMKSYYLLIGTFGTSNPTVEYTFTVNFTPAQGACCMGTSCEVLTQSACGTMGGTYQGDNASCNGGPQYVDATQFTLVDGVSTAGGTVGGATSTLNVTDMALLSTIEVYVDLIHSFAGDLTIRLTAPNGTTSATLIERPGRASDCLTNGSPFGNLNDLDGEYLWTDTATVESHAAIVAGPTPVPDLVDGAGVWRANGCGGTTVDLNATFAGVQIQGTWTLAIEDRAGGDTGVLRGWKMAINGGSNPPCEDTPTPCPGDFNDDGVVDLLDLLAFNSVWSGSLGQSVPPGNAQADYNNDLIVDLLDLLGFNSAWSGNLGQMCP